MGAPYRDPGGVACPRCAAMMATQDDGGLACANGCGAWVPTAAITRMLGTANLTKRGEAAPFFKVLPLPPTKCFGCANPLTALYRTAADNYLTLGQCVQHGVWCEQRTRADFELAFHHEIAGHRHDQTKVVHQSAEQLRSAAMERRVATLERQVELLTERLEALDRS